jgi:hypothetical protein
MLYSFHLNNDETFASVHRWEDLRFMGTLCLDSGEWWFSPRHLAESDGHVPMGLMSEIVAFVGELK